MSLRAAAAEASLNMSYGDDRGPLAPDTLEIALYSGDPAFDGVELNDTDCPGYARLTVANDNTTWLPAADGEKRSVLLTFPATDQWTRAATYVQIYDAGSDQPWDSSELGEPMTLPEDFEDGPQIQIVLFYDTNFEVN